MREELAQLGSLRDQKLGEEVSLLVDVLRAEVVSLQGNLATVVTAPVLEKVDGDMVGGSLPPLSPSCQTYTALDRNITACHSPEVVQAGVSALGYLEFLIKNFEFVLYLPGKKKIEPNANEKHFKFSLQRP